MGTLMPGTDRMCPVHRRYPVRVGEDVGELRRAVATLAASLPGLPAGDAELVATELATNILRHAGGGYVLCQPVPGGIELIAVDRGPGLATAHGPRRPHRGLGVGLAGVRARTSTFDHYSSPRGTVVLARLRPTGTRGATVAGWWRWGGVNVPLGGTGNSGDAWAVTTADDGRLAAVMVDGLGHGDDAAAAAHAAITAFHQHSPTAPEGGRLTDVVLRAHEAMRGTRGGVFGLCLVDPHHGRTDYTGIGNITGRVLTGSVNEHLLSPFGTLGTQLAPPTPRQTTHPWAAGATLVLCTDGIDTRWDPAIYPGLARHDPAVVAATLYREHARETDDAAVLVIQDTRDQASAGGDR